MGECGETVGEIEVHKIAVLARARQDHRSRCNWVELTSASEGGGGGQPTQPTQPPQPPNRPTAPTDGSTFLPQLILWGWGVGRGALEGEGGGSGEGGEGLATDPPPLPNGTARKKRRRRRQFFFLQGVSKGATLVLRKGGFNSHPSD